MDCIAALSDLQVLLMNRCPVTDSTVSKLRRLRKLSTLALDGASITDECIDDLIALELDYLFVFHTQMSQAGIDELRRRMPTCRVVE